MMNSPNETQSPIPSTATIRMMAMYDETCGAGSGAPSSMHDPVVVLVVLDDRRAAAAALGLHRRHA